MKAIVVGLAMTAAAMSGFFIGVFWERGNKTAHVEDAVAAEIRLLESYKNSPTCDQLRSASAGEGEVKASGAIVHWRLLPGANQIARVVVADDLTVAYETTESPCLAKAPATH